MNFYLFFRLKGEDKYVFNVFFPGGQRHGDECLNVIAGYLLFGVLVVFPDVMIIGTLCHRGESRNALTRKNVSVSEFFYTRN